jgi:hypothetical protein
VSDERAAAIEAQWRRIGLMDGADAEYLLAEVKRLRETVEAVEALPDPRPGAPMKGELFRGKRTNHVRVYLEVRGSTETECPHCAAPTSHAILEFNLIMCGLCNRVRAR